MNKLTTVAALAAMGLSSQAFGYSATANVTFAWSTDGIHKGWTSSAANTLGTISNSTYFTQEAGNNSTTYYNPDFAKAGDATGWCPPGNEAFQAQYACKITTNTAIPTAGNGNLGPGAAATGSISVTDTTLTGTLTVITTSDEGAGPQPGTTAATGFNVRSADGSPFKNVWYGFSNTATLSLNLTGTFTAGSWNITGGTATLADGAFQCAVADFSGVLCNPSTVAGGFQSDGSMLSWGMDQGTGPNTGVTEIAVFDPTGASQIGTLGGVLASLNVDGGGNITTTAGEWRSGSGSSGGGCLTSIRYNAAGTTISCGTLAAGLLDVSGSVNVIPVPAAVWLFGSALGLMGVARRRMAA